MRLRQRVFGIFWDRPNQKKKQSFVLLNADEEEGKDTVWVAKVLSLFRVRGCTEKSEKQLAFVQYMCVSKPLNGVDQALGCVCLRWDTEDGVDHTLHTSSVLRHDHIHAGAWFGLVPFHSIVGTVPVLRSNISIQPFTNPLPWPLHRFRINRFLLSADEAIGDDPGSDEQSTLGDVGNAAPVSAVSTPSY